MTDSGGVCAGMAVITLAVNLPGPLVAFRLGELGAEVVKVEPPGGDPLARYRPDYSIYPAWED